MPVTQDLAHCTHLLSQGELVAIPTETVYGLAGIISNPEALDQIFKVKGRPLFNPLIVHLHSIEQLPVYARSIPEGAWELARKFWPGPLTLILPKSNAVPNEVTGGKDTVGLRIPQHALTLELLKKLKTPVAAPSANPFMKISPTNAKHVINYFPEITVLDGGECKVGLESTIVGFEENEPILYRLGGISPEEIEAISGPLKRVTHNEENPEAPGMLGKHYAPNTPLILSENIEKDLKVFFKKKVGLLTLSPTGLMATEMKVLSANGNLKEAASKLFKTLHELDQLNLDVVIAEKFPNVGLGSSINDRLERASKR